MSSQRNLFTIFGTILAATSHLCSATGEDYSTIVHDSFIVPTLTGKEPADYEVSVESISLTDVDTGISDIKSIHNGRPFDVIAKLHWEEQIFDLDSTNTLFWEMSIGGQVQDIGAINLNAVSSIIYIYSYTHLVYLHYP